MRLIHRLIGARKRVVQASPVTPTGTQWNELVPTETPSPTPIETGFGQPIECPTTYDSPRSEIRDGRLHGGGLSIEPPAGSNVEVLGLAVLAADANASLGSNRYLLTFAGLGAVGVGGSRRGTRESARGRRVRARDHAECLPERAGEHPGIASPARRGRRSWRRRRSRSRASSLVRSLTAR